MKAIENITQESFERFGKIIEFSAFPADERFEVVVEEPAHPWRLAVFRVKIKEAGRMECHPDSMESFEPIEGTGLLLVAENHSPQDFHVFLLDRPVCLYKGVWHELLTLSEISLYKITENRQVASRFYYFEKMVKPIICSFQQ
jgi:ureidoglycolate hydrolase